MRIRRPIWSLMLCLVVALSGCSPDAGCNAKHQADGDTVAAASGTPAFRNLGKRDESTL